MDPGAERVIRKLERAGYEAYAVGGCVRDALIGVTASDWDITTSARPEEVMGLFLKTFATGIEHGTITVREMGESYEVTTFRLDGKYSDHRRPDSVTYAASLYEDVARRDFTINAMAYHPLKGVIDYFEGREDLKRQVIRCVGDPMKRFEEDALRMLRAVRFSAKLGFRIEEATWEAMKKLSPTLINVSKERILEETTKTLVSAHPSLLKLAEESGLTKSFCEEFARGKELTYDALEKVRAEKKLRFALLLSEFTPKDAEKALRQLKADNDTIAGVKLFLEHLKDPAPENAEGMRRWMGRVGKKEIPDLLEIRLAKGIDTEDKNRQLLKLYEEEKGHPVTLKEMALTGHDLIHLGAMTGKELGRALQMLLDEVLKDPDNNHKETLISIYEEKIRGEQHE